MEMKLDIKTKNRLTMRILLFRMQLLLMMLKSLCSILAQIKLFNKSETVSRVTGNRRVELGGMGRLDLRASQTPRLPFNR
jgi:hypothetical protein